MKIILCVLLLIALPAGAAEIYKCRMSNGGEFWSSAQCRQAGGYMIDIVTVPSNMTWDEQVKFAEQARGQQAQQTRVASDEYVDRDRARECGAIDLELKQIWSRYEGGQFQPPERVAPDQIRTRELNRRRSELRCQSR